MNNRKHKLKFNEWIGFRRFNGSLAVIELASNDWKVIFSLAPTWAADGLRVAAGGGGGYVGRSAEEQSWPGKCWPACSEELDLKVGRYSTAGFLPHDSTLTLRLHVVSGTCILYLIVFLLNWVLFKLCVFNKIIDVPDPYLNIFSCYKLTPGSN